MMDWNTPIGIVCGVSLYFAVLLTMAWRTGGDASNAQFFLASRRAHWLVVSLGMIGATLSGITFISIPGLVGAQGPSREFSYLQLVAGYVLGYVIIATILLPLYYRLNLTSIYGYLEQRFGKWSFRTGSATFIVSQLLINSLRLLILIEILHKFALAELGVPFWVGATVVLSILWLYTFRSGIHTIVWTDLVQTGWMLLAVVWTIFACSQLLDRGWADVFQVWNAGQARIFVEPDAASNIGSFIHAVVSGALITVAMTGLDQDRMQKNLTCRTLAQSQKNMFLFSGLLVMVNVLFLSLGAVMFLLARQRGIELPTETDLVYPTIAFGHLASGLGLIFLLGVLAATFSGADSALTAMTTTTCVDFLGFGTNSDQRVQRRVRAAIQLGFAVLTVIVVLVLHRRNTDQSAILRLLSLVGLTYGPLLGLFAFGLCSRRRLREPLVPLVCISAPLIAYYLEQREFFCGVRLGSLLILASGLLSLIGLAAISRAATQHSPNREA
jgi:Na+/proline symporter